MARYVDGYILPVPKNKLKAYKKMAQQAGKLWKKHGALEYIESVGDDLNSKWSTIKFPKAVKGKSSELVIFSYVVFKSRSHRDTVNAKVMKDMKDFMADPKNKDKPIPFDMKRLGYGGFRMIVDV